MSIDNGFLSFKQLWPKYNYYDGETRSILLNLFNSRITNNYLIHAAKHRKGGLQGINDINIIDLKYLSENELKSIKEKAASFYVISQNLICFSIKPLTRMALKSISE